MNHKELEKKVRALGLFERLETDHATYQREVGGYSVHKEVTVSSETGTGGYWENVSTTHLFIPINGYFFDDEYKGIEDLRKLKIDALKKNKERGD